MLTNNTCYLESKQEALIDRLAFLSVVHKAGVLMTRLTQNETHSMAANCPISQQKKLRYSNYKVIVYSYMK